MGERSIKVEIRAAEGGTDAKLLVREQFQLYSAAQKRHGFTVDVLEDTPGRLVFGVAGNVDFFTGEAGGHRWQRVPPTEKRGRVQTSTVTVAVLDVARRSAAFDERRIRWEFFCSGGPGGQNQNKVASGARGRYQTAGGEIVSESREAREQGSNRKLVIAKLRDLVINGAAKAVSDRENTDRAQMIGAGERGDKIRTYREQDDSVRGTDGGRARLSSLRKGDWGSLKPAAATSPADKARERGA